MLDDTGYRKLSDKYKIKSLLVPDAKINVSIEQIGKGKKEWVAFYNENMLSGLNIKEIKQLLRLLV